MMIKLNTKIIAPTKNKIFHARIIVHVKTVMNINSLD